MTNTEIEQRVFELKQELVRVLTKAVSSNERADVTDLELKIADANQLWVLQHDLHLQERE